MSVLIKGMKMPKACCECGFNHCSQSRDDDTCLLLDKGISQLFVLVDRLPDCPLVEVPKPQNRPATWGDVYDSLKVLEALLETIEAEEGEAHDA